MRSGQNPPTSTGSFSGNTITNFEIRPGLETVCTFYNSLAEGTITVIKHVVNDNGGTASAGDFTIDLGDGNTTFPGAEAPGTTNTFTHGYAYNVSESGPGGYSASYSGDCSGTIEAGVDKTCTITNDDVAPTLTIVKTVVNDNGGTKQVSDFPLFINGNAATSGTAYTLSAGTHTASETQQAGYTASDWGGDCAADGSVTLNLGEHKTCTITNDDQQAYITVVKVVNNDNGGTAHPMTSS